MIKYIADSVECLDKVNGNIYASTRIIATETGDGAINEALTAIARALDFSKILIVEN